MDAATRTALEEHLDRVRHDLGRYVCFAVRGLAPDAPDAERADALRADLLSTRRGPSGVIAAPALWADLRAPLVGAAPLPGGAYVDLRDEIVEIDAAMAEVAAVCAALDGPVDAATLDRGIAAATAASDAVRALVRRFRAPPGGGGRR